MLQHPTHSPQLHRGIDFLRHDAILSDSKGSGTEPVPVHVALPAGIKADAVRAAVTANLTELPRELRRSLTWDRGREMAEHQLLTQELTMPVYFCDARKPWQRGTNENTNRLLRQYLSKTANLTDLTRDNLDAIEQLLNNRPRHVLEWHTPTQILARSTTLQNNGDRTTG